MHVCHVTMKAGSTQHGLTCVFAAHHLRNQLATQLVMHSASLPVNSWSSVTQAVGSKITHSSCILCKTQLTPTVKEELEKENRKGKEGSICGTRWKQEETRPIPLDFVFWVSKLLYNPAIDLKVTVESLYGLRGWSDFTFSCRLVAVDKCFEGLLLHIAPMRMQIPPNCTQHQSLRIVSFTAAAAKLKS